jgi:DNA-directed RNA polymerase specialized sigma24 family protein
VRVFPDPARIAQAYRGRVLMQASEQPACGEVVADEQPRPVDPTYALFRRAICQADPDAWAAIVATFRGLVLGTIRKQPGSYLITSDDDWVYRSFERFWHAVPPARFAEFRDTPSLARYLKLCAASTYLDALRDQRRHAALDLEQVDPAALPADDLEAELLGQQAGRELWTAITGLLKNDTERAIAYLSFVRGLTPREIVATDPARFGSIEQLYQAKRRILDRLRLHLPAVYSSVRC